MIIFGELLVCDEGVQSFQRSAGHQRNPAESGVIGKKNEFFGAIGDCFFCNVFFCTGGGKTVFYGDAGAGDEGCGNIVSFQIVLDIRTCKGQRLTVQLSGNGDNIQAGAGYCLVEDEETVGEDRAASV